MKNPPKFSPTRILSSLIHNTFCEKVDKNFLQFSNKLPKVSSHPKWRKFAQSGHPAKDAISNG
jgi:hypothetical protein